MATTAYAMTRVVLMISIALKHNYTAGRKEVSQEIYLLLAPGPAHDKIPLRGSLPLRITRWLNRRAAKLIDIRPYFRKPVGKFLLLKCRS